jgi:Flp pilus assembly protein TadD
LVLSSLMISGALYFDVVAASPLFLLLVGGVHLVFAFVFYKAYRHYHAVHRLVTVGRGELFLLAISNLILSTRIRAFRDHYRLRKCQGLALTGQPLEALSATEEYRREVKRPEQYALDVVAVEIEANIQLGQLTWSEEALERAQELKGYHDHEGLRAVVARLQFENGDAAGAVKVLAHLLHAKDWSMTKSIRARNLFWYGQALMKNGQETEARIALKKAYKQAPESFYGQLASRPF